MNSTDFVKRVYIIHFIHFQMLNHKRIGSLTLSSLQWYISHFKRSQIWVPCNNRIVFVHLCRLAKVNVVVWILCCFCVDVVLWIRKTLSLNHSTVPGNFPQSLSGSETDVSTSNENLSNEEKYVIRHTPRQEPQGEENLQASNRSSLRDSLPSNRSSLDVSSSSYNTLIIHSAGDEPWSGE